jgi:hypothetical protein
MQTNKHTKRKDDYRNFIIKVTDSDISLSLKHIEKLHNLLTKIKAKSTPTTIITKRREQVRLQLRNLGQTDQTTYHELEPAVLPIGVEHVLVFNQKQAQVLEFINETVYLQHRIQTSQ